MAITPYQSLTLQSWIFSEFDLLRVQSIKSLTSTELDLFRVRPFKSLTFSQYDFLIISRWEFFPSSIPLLRHFDCSLGSEEVNISLHKKLNSFLWWQNIWMKVVLTYFSNVSFFSRLKNEIRFASKLANF